jgi:hypothetical protein
MSIYAQVSAKSAADKPPPVGLAHTGILQRQCACGNQRGPSGECTECRQKRLPGVQSPTLLARPSFRIAATVEKTTESASPAASKAGGSKQQPTAAASSNCSPRGLSRADYLRQPGTSQNEFGLTSLDLGQVTYPQIRLTGRPGRHRLQPTQAALPTIPSIYTTSGTFTEGEAIFGSQGDGNCPSGRYPIRWTITRQGAQKIHDGEAEHCADYQFAFAQSLAPFRDAVNRLARARTRFPSRRAAERRLQRITSVSPSQWQTVFTCLACKSKVLRDDRLRLHTPRPRTIPPSYRSNCEYVRRIITGSSLRGVGRRTPDQIITGCTTTNEQQRVIRQCS